MGKAGRIACIALPWCLTVVSLVCLIIVTLPGLSNNNLMKSVYLFKANTTGFTANPTNITLPDALDGVIDEDLLKSLQTAASTHNLEDWYAVGLWSYCYGDYEAGTGKEVLKRCSQRSTSFWFNPVSVWGLNDTAAQRVFPDKLNNGLNAYKNAAKAMVAFYFVAIVATAAALLIGIAGIFSRWGSFVTTIVQSISGLAILAFAGTATGIYLALFSVFNSVLKPYQIKAIFPARAMTVIWIAAAAAAVASLFWLISTCCCSGKSSGGRKTVTVEKTPYTYERVASPYLGAASHGHGHGHEMRNMGGASGSGAGAAAAGGSGAYEPFRHHGADGKV